MRVRKLLSRPLVIAVAIAAGAGAVSLTQLGGTASASATQDKITYNQTTGNNGTYINYVPGDGSKTTKESVTSGGGCATPSPSGVPILAFSAAYYPNGYANASQPAIVGAYKSRTGVCQITQAWSIEQNEGLIFSIGSNSLVAGREFSRAVLQLEREDKSTSAPPNVQVDLVLRGGPSVVTKSYSLPGPNGATLPAIDTGDTAGFTSIEIRVVSPDTGSISVVGPTSTFYLANEICPGQTITDTSTDGSASAGQVSASFTFVSAPGGACKSYTTFDASASDPTSSTLKSVQFLAQTLAGAHMTASFDWGYFPYCRPDATPDPAHPDALPCPTTKVDFGNGFVDQTFCAPNGATVTTPWCTTSKHFDYVQDPADSSQTVVHITETWDGLGDVYFRH
jgi:hypothetical protein